MKQNNFKPVCLMSADSMCAAVSFSQQNDVIKIAQGGRQGQMSLLSFTTTHTTPQPANYINF